MFSSQSQAITSYIEAYLLLILLQRTARLSSVTECIVHRLIFSTCTVNHDHECNERPHFVLLFQYFVNLWNSLHRP